MLGDELLRRIEQGIKSIEAETYKNIIMKTPVDADGGTDAGRARANWICSYDAPAQHERKQNDTDGNKTVMNMLPKVDNSTWGDKVYLSNNVPYIQKLEYGLYPNPPKNGSGKTINGYSTQAPKGMVRNSFQEMTKDLTEKLGATKD